LNAIILVKSFSIHGIVVDYWLVYWMSAKTILFAPKYLENHRFYYLFNIFSFLYLAP